MELKELLMACHGEDAHGMPKATLTVLNEFWHENGERELIDELALETPYLNFFIGEGFLQLDLEFGSRNNVELKLMCDMLESFRTAENSYSKADGKVAMTTIMIMPEEYNGQYFVICANPFINALTAKAPNDPLTIVRMAFFEDYVAMFEDEDYVPESDLDEYHIKDRDQDEDED